MYASTTFGGWHPLNSVTAGFVIELVSASAFDFDGDELVTTAWIGGPIDAVLSTFASRQPGVHFGQFGDEEFGVETALGGSDFDSALHCDSQKGYGYTIYLLA